MIMAILNVGDYVKTVGNKWYMVVLSPGIVFMYKSICSLCALNDTTECLARNPGGCRDTIRYDTIR